LASKTQTYPISQDHDHSTTQIKLKVTRFKLWLFKFYVRLEKSSGDTSGCIRFESIRYYLNDLIENKVNLSCLEHMIDADNIEVNHEIRERLMTKNAIINSNNTRYFYLLVKMYLEKLELASTHSLNLMVDDFYFVFSRLIDSLHLFFKLRAREVALNTKK
jgi:hypothetical protein